MPVNFIGIDYDGNLLSEWDDASELCSYDSNQRYEGMVKTNSGFFIIWNDDREGADIYGQMVSFNGDLLGPPDGIPIVTASNDQQSPTLTYNGNANEIMVCWEDFRNGTDFDIYCSTIDENTLSITSNIDLCI